MADELNDFERPFDFGALFGDRGDGGDTAEAHAEGHAEPNDAERCRQMAQEVQRELVRPLFNIMRPCRGEIQIPRCAPLGLPDFRPRVYVFWGDSRCDCIEGDDTEIMTILVYNPYSNVTLTNVNINRIRVVDGSGATVPNLPDGSEAVQLVPRGTYCFGDLPPCGFAFRQFVLRLRGAAPGPYRILIEGICFELCLHRMVEECVTFDVCKD